MGNGDRSSPAFTSRCGHRAHAIADLPPGTHCPECGAPVGRTIATLQPPPPVPRCKRCAYVLEGLFSPGECPECGQYFDLSLPGTFSIKPPFIGWKFWLPGLATAAACGAIVLIVCVFGFHNFGAATWIGTPLAAGIVLGYRFRPKLFLIICGILTLICCLVLTVISLNLGGVFCGIVLSAVFLGPIIVGLLLGMLTRVIMKGTRFSQRSYLPILLAMLIPMLWAWAEGPPPRRAAVSVHTETILDATPQEAWDSIMFYEEVTHEPPWILKVGLARPLRTSGSSSRVGDIKTCIYNKGPITKRITAVEPCRRLAFDVIEQHIGYERDVRLVGGSFEFEPAGEGKVRVRLTTSYEPRLAPRLCWRPAEALAVHILHDYVMEGMRLRCQSSRNAHIAAAGSP